MYLNTKLFKEKGLQPEDLYYLLAIKQIDIDIVKTIPDAVFNRFAELLLLKEVKRKNKSQSVLELIRLDKAGIELLENIETPEIIEEDLKIFDWLKNIYLESEKELGNQKKTKLFIALFRSHTGISKNCLAHLCQSFINDGSQFEWSKKLEFLFFKPANMYEKFSIDASKLYQYYLKSQNEFDKQFEKWE